MKRLRVLQVLEATAGGTRRHLKDILLGLSGGPFDFHLVCATRRDPGFRDDLRAFREVGVGVSILDMRRRPNPVGDLVAACRLRRILRLGWDLVHLHSAKAGLVGRLAALGLDLPVIYSPHAFPFLQRGWIGRMAWLAEKALSGRTTALHAVSQAEARLAIETGLADERRVIVLENPVDLEKLRRNRQVEAVGQGRQGPVVFGFLGELREQKDPLTFVRAASEARRRRVDARFVMPRRGPMLSEVEGAVRAFGLESSVEFVDSRESLDALYQRSDIGVLPSRWEGLPYALLDAMALRMPVIASSLPVFRDVLETLDRSLIFETGDPVGLASRFSDWSVAGRERARVVGAAAHQRAAGSLSMSNWKLGLVGMYRSVATRAVPREESESLTWAAG